MRRGRQCIEPHVSEVIELLPLEVAVRRDIREQLACVACEGELVRAPAGETVVPNSELGLVASLLKSTLAALVAALCR